MGHTHTAILFQFPQEEAARLAFDTLQELGYDPQLHEGSRLHIHVENEDLTSALEIVQSHGGQWVEQAPAEAQEVTSRAFGLDCIPIPAHTVNEDLEEVSVFGMEVEVGTELGSSAADDHKGESRTDTEERELRNLHPDSGSYDHFEAR